MDDLIFRYLPGQSALHRFDPRFKLPAFALLCLAVMKSSPAGFPAALLIIVSAALFSKIPLRLLFRGFLKFLPLTVLFFIALFLSEPDRYRFVPAALSAARFASLLWAGNVMIQTTSLKDISSAAAWFLKPLPFINSGRAALMAGLTVGLIPVFFHELGESRDALLSRGLSPKKRPLRWVTSLTGPLLTRLFLKTGDTAEAMEARCYTDTRSFAPLKARKSDWAILGGVVIFSIVSLFL